ncbi:MAG: amidohydrolase [Gammaproteobacteria bacterium]|nr:amidohydrolase [Gammaproteobacteria bacterium]
MSRKPAIRYRNDPAGCRLPIKLDSTSNGEYVPIPLDDINRQSNRVAQEHATAHAKRSGMARREFMVSLCGAASTLLAFNTVNAATQRSGGFYDLTAAASVDPDAAKAQLDGREFIFDVQGHFVNPEGKWLERLPPTAKPLTFAPKTACALANKPGERSYLQCLGAKEFIKDVFLDSDTDMMVLSFVPSTYDSEPLTIEEAAQTRAIVEEMDGSHRLLLHGRCNPNQAGDMERMEELAHEWKIAAWKCYTQYGPDGSGFFLNDEIGIAFVENARRLKVKNIAVHKGIPFGRKSYAHSTCADIGPIAKRFPDMNFLIYHSGWVPGAKEGPYDPSRPDGIDALITSVLKSEVVAQGNVYAELGSTWRGLMRDPGQAAHGIGKLLKHLGEDNVVWGTDSIWYGSPQDQILAFRAFQISEEFQERYGYPQITPQIRSKIFGLNAARPYNISLDEANKRTVDDRITRQRHAYRHMPDPHFLTLGPKTRREFLNLLRWNGGRYA